MWLCQYSDFSVELQKQRATFTEVKRRMRETVIVYSVAYQARLRVIDGSRVHFFTIADAAQDWLAAKSSSY